MGKKVVIYTASYCPHCRRAKDLLKAKKIAFEEIDVTDDEAKRDEIQARTGWMTVPVILIDGKLIGGADDLCGLEKRGELDRLLA